MRQKATRSKASGAIVEYMGAIARAWPRRAEQSTFTLLVVAVTLPWQFPVKYFFRANALLADALLINALLQVLF